MLAGTEQSSKIKDLEIIIIKLLNYLEISLFIVNENIICQKCILIGCGSVCEYLVLCCVCVCLVAWPSRNVQ